MWSRYSVKEIKQCQVISQLYSASLTVPAIHMIRPHAVHTGKHFTVNENGDYPLYKKSTVCAHLSVKLICLKQTVGLVSQYICVGFYRRLCVLSSVLPPFSLYIYSPPGSPFSTLFLWVITNETFEKWTSGDETMGTHKILLRHSIRQNQFLKKSLSPKYCIISADFPSKRYHLYFYFRVFISPLT